MIKMLFNLGESICSHFFHFPVTSCLFIYIRIQSKRMDLVCANVTTVQDQFPRYFGKKRSNFSSHTVAQRAVVKKANLIRNKIYCLITKNELYGDIQVYDDSLMTFSTDPPQRKLVCINNCNRGGE